MPLPLRNINQAVLQEWEAELSATRAGKLSLRGLQTLVNTLLYPATDLDGAGYSAVVLRGLAASAGSGLTVNLTSPAVVVQRVGEEIAELAVMSGTLSVTHTTASPTYPRWDIIEARISTRAAFTDSARFRVNQSTATLEVGSVERDQEVYLEIRATAGTPAPSPVPPALGAEGQAQIIGSVALSNPFDATARYLLKFAIGRDAEFVEVDLRDGAASPAAMTHAEAIAHVQAAVDTFDDGGAFTMPAGIPQLVGGGNGGAASVIKIREASTITADASGVLFGNQTFSPLGIPRYGYYEEFEGTRPFFKVAEVYIDAGATTLDAGDIVTIAEQASWQNDSNTILSQPDSFVDFWLAHQKNVANGVPGLNSLFDIQLLTTVTGLFTSLLKSAATAIRNWTFPDETGHVAIAPAGHYHGGIYSDAAITPPFIRAGSYHVFATDYVNDLGRVLSFRNNYETDLQDNAFKFSRQAFDTYCWGHVAMRADGTVIWLLAHGDAVVGHTGTITSITGGGSTKTLTRATGTIGTETGNILVVTGTTTVDGVYKITGGNGSSTVTFESTGTTAGAVGNYYIYYRTGTVTADADVLGNFPEPQDPVSLSGFYLGANGSRINTLSDTGENPVYRILGSFYLDSLGQVAFVRSLPEFVQNGGNFSKAQAGVIGSRPAAAVFGSGIYLRTDTDGRGIDYSDASAWFTQSPIYTDWQSYTPTFTGLGATANVSGYWKRVGDTLHLRAKVTTGTCTGTEAQWSLPSGFTTSSAISTIEVCHGSEYAATVNQTGVKILCRPSNTYLVFGKLDTGSAGLTASNGNVVFADSNTFSLVASVPIA